MNPYQSPVDSLATDSWRDWSIAKRMWWSFKFVFVPWLMVVLFFGDLLLWQHFGRVPALKAETPWEEFCRFLGDWTLNQ